MPIWTRSFAKVDSLISQGKRAAADKLLDKIDQRYGGLAAPRSLEISPEHSAAAAVRRQSMLCVACIRRAGVIVLSSSTRCPPSTLHFKVNPMNTFDAGKTLARNSYDSEVPPNLLEFMLQELESQGSASCPRCCRMPRRSASGASACRKNFPNELLVIPTGHRKVRANDTYYVFRPGTDFYYLTGVLEPDCVLLMVPKAQGAGHDHVLFVEPNPGKSDTTFFTDRNKGELWEGPRFGVAESATRYALTCQPLPELCSPRWSARLRPAAGLRVLRGFSDATELMLPAQRRGAGAARPGTRGVPVGDATAQGRGRSQGAAERHHRHQARL